MNREFVLGIDFGSNSARALIVDADNGTEYGSAGCVYPGGTQGIYTSEDTNLARQNPLSYLEAMRNCVCEAIGQASAKSDFSRTGIIGIGIDATASTPIPVDARLRPLAADERFKNNLNAFAWMWKDHTAIAEAAEITALAKQQRPEYLRKCGGSYSSEWYWAKILRCLNVDREVFSEAVAWIDFPDFIPAALGGIKQISELRPGICAAGHKALYCEDWGGYPDETFLSALDPELAKLRRRMTGKAVTPEQAAAYLSPEWAEQLGLTSGIPIAAGIIDAHSGAVGAGIAEGRMVKIIGTSTCDLIVTPDSTASQKEIPGICGMVRDSVLPGLVGIEAGQAAAGDIFNWFATRICGGGHETLAELEKEAAGQPPGRHGLIALDWHNGNRNILCDQQLTGMIIGITLHTSRADIYRALVESTAFGAGKILDRLEEYGVAVNEVICGGGIVEKSPLLMQIYADVLERKLLIPDSSQTCALGAAIFAAVAAGKYESARVAQKQLCRFKQKTYTPIAGNVAVYRQMYDIYGELHDGFGGQGAAGDYAGIMKKMLAIAAARQ